MGEVHVDEILLFVKHIIQCGLNVFCNRIKIRETLAVMQENMKLSSVNGEETRVQETVEYITEGRL